jgi:hypothetical protein
MIDHVVLLDVRADVQAATLARFEHLLAALPERIDEVESVRFGPSVSPEGLEQGYSYGFLITFADEHARDRYLPHPEHQPISTLAQQMAERVLVFDIAS